jgi:ABC-type dipeptide/oligopeptide/nickel transport system permease component
VSKTVFGKVGGALVTLFGASILAFVFVRVLPGDPVRLILGRLASPQAVVAQRHAMGLDQSLPAQYWHYIASFFRGDWGFAYTIGQPVTTVISTRVPASIELALYAFALAFLGAVLLALLVTYRRRRWADGVVRLISFVGLGTPPFWLALLLLLAFSQNLHWLPGPDGRLSSNVMPPPAITHLYTVDALIAGQFSTFWDALRHLVLPACTLAFASFAFLVRLLRASLLEVSREPFITVVRGKGLSRWDAFVHHALPNAFLPVVTAGGLVLAEMLAGSVLVETVFSWPGIGALIVEAIQRKDFAIVQAFIFLSALMYICVNFAVDLLYGVIDPRARAASGVAR